MHLALSSKPTRHVSQLEERPHEKIVTADGCLHFSLDTPPLRDPGTSPIRIFAASVASVALVTIPCVFRCEEQDIWSCWRSGSSLTFPVCNPATLKTPPIPLPLALLRVYNCESLFIVLSGAIVIHTSCVLAQFQQPRWRSRYVLPALSMLVFSLVLGMFMSMDAPTLFLQVLPVGVDLCMIGSYIADSFARRV
ncbi:hypothetical protein V2G26_004707 [Clonostachys chloroleuca]